ncbi:flavin reductase (NADPH) [Planococcus citri]|uniref:flavin reductase (NADPH) n=1 Tax=Planococcus citri TaxID=170843 RepID=UPI0031F800FA
MKKIAIFGASGMTGVCAVEAALNLGLEVRALLRDPSKMAETYRNKIEIIQGDVLVESDVEKTVEGRDAVVVALGTRNDLSPTTAMSTGLSNILSAMKKANVEKISVCLSAFLFYEPDKVPKIFKDLNEDHQRMFDLLKKEDTLKWIAILPPHIADTPNTPYTIKHDSSPGRAISKRSLGEFLVESLDKPEHYNQVCGIATVVPSS